jgi:hypothetical protein
MNKKLINLVFCLILFSCNKNIKDNQNTPSWYVNPKQNNHENLYGVSEGFTIEEATKFALADLASRLIVSISSESTMLREENQNSTNEEIRQKIKQDIEKITFTNFRISRSEKSGQKFYVEVEINKKNFLNEQKDRLEIIEKKINDLDKNSNSNPIQRRNALIKINQYCKELEIKAMILKGGNISINLKEKLIFIAKFQSELDRASDDLEFFIDNKSNNQIADVIKNSLNKEKIKTSTKYSQDKANQIKLTIKSSIEENKIFESYITKIRIKFENNIKEKIVASNSIEVTGSSIISYKESYNSAITSLQQKIDNDGIMQTIGIISF